MHLKGYLFAYISTAIFIIAIMVSPKRLNKREIYTTWFVVAALTLNIDLIFGLIFDQYDFITSEVSLNDLVLQAILAPSAAVLALNHMPKTRSRFVIYLLCVTALSILFEWLSVLFGYLVYKGWKLWYSIPFYLLGMLYMRWHLHFLRKGK